MLWHFFLPTTAREHGEKFEDDASKINWEKANKSKKEKSDYLFVSVSHPSNEKNIAKSMTILKLCERSFK